MFRIQFRLDMEFVGRELISGNLVVSSSDSKEEIIKDETNRANILIPQLSTNNITLLENPEPQISINYAQIPYVDLTKNSSVKRWSLFASGGISSVTRSLMTDDTEYMDLLNRRNEIEKVIGGWHFVTGFGYRLSVPISISLGLRMNQIHERSTYTSNYLVKSTEEGIETIIHNQDGTQSFLTGSIDVFTERSTSEIRNNEYRYYSIPISISYRLIENEKYKLSLNGGFAYSIAQSYNGFTSFDETQPAYSLTEDSSNLFKNSGLISYGLGINISRSFGENWNIILGFNLENTDNISNITNPINQKYRTQALTIGVSHKL